MKKKIAITTVILMLSAYTAVFSQEPLDKNAENLSKIKAINYSEIADKEVSPEKLKSILSDVKQRFVIYDQDAEFKYSLSLESGINMYNLSWEGPKYTTYVKYGEDKNIYWYYNSKKDQGVYTEERIKKLPAYDKKYAQDIAQAFLQKALPEQYKNFTVKVDSGILSSNMYNFEFNYTKNGVIVDSINANVAVDAAEGKVSSYSTTFDNSITYEDMQGVISKEEAKNVYKNELGIKLIYKSDYDYENNKIKGVNLVYTPNYNSNYVIDAKTGKRIDISRGVGGEGYAGSSMADKTVAENMNQEKLTEQEISEIQSKADLASLNEAKEKVKSYNLEVIDKDMNVESAQLYESRQNTKSGYIWSISYIGNSFENRAGVELDAKTLELLGFSSYNYSYSENEVTKSQIELAKKEAEKIIKKYSKIPISKLAIDETALENQLKSRNSNIYITYNRIENQVEFPENNITVAYDAINNKVVSYSKYWYEINFPQTNNVVSKDVIYDKIFKENGISLKYKIAYNNSMKMESNLIYEINQDDYKKPLIFDALTGKRIVYDYSTEKPVLEYKDLNKSKYKEEVKTLLSLGIGFQGGELNPEQAIREDELLYLIAQTFEYVPVPLYKIDSLTKAQKKEVENQLKYTGILKENETMTSREITREETIKYLVRALGYEKIALHSEIFKLGLSDADKADSAHIGYIAIGDALDIITKDSKNNFNPKDKTTRDEALKMIYNYLK
ncbi:MAG: YcdB/YcdC domain-containing protein [Proteocatella sp.]